MTRALDGPAATALDALPCALMSFDASGRVCAHNARLLQLRAALDGYQKTEQARDAAVVAAAYETLIAALRALVDEHRKLEADAPVDATLIRLWAARVEEIAGRLRAAGHAGG